jgi:hypothetical protein
MTYLPFSNVTQETASRKNRTKKTAPAYANTAPPIDLFADRPFCAHTLFGSRSPQRTLPQKSAEKFLLQKTASEHLLLSGQ